VIGGCPVLPELRQLWLLAHPVESQNRNTGEIHSGEHCNRGRDKIKLLCRERNGFIVGYKHLEKQRFRWPASRETLTLSGQELNGLLDGFDLFNNQPHSRVHFDSVT